MSHRSPDHPPASEPGADRRPDRTGRWERSGRVLLRRVVLGVGLAEQGLFDRTVEILDDTHPRLRRHPMVEEVEPVLPGFLANLGLARILCGGFGAAEDHLSEARSLARERGLGLLELVTRQNLGCLALRRGDTATAITTFVDLAHRLPADRREALCADLAEALLAEGRWEEAARTLADGPWSHGRSSQPVTLLVEAKLRLLRGDRYRATELARRVRCSHGPGSLWYRLADRVERAAERSCPSPLSRARTALELRRPLSASLPTPRVTAAHRALDRLTESPWTAVDDRHVSRAGLEAALSRGDLPAAVEWAERVDPPTVPVPPASPQVERYREALARGRERHCLVHARRWELTRYARGVPRPPAHGPVGARLSELSEDRAFVRLVGVAGDVVALVVVKGGVHTRPLGPVTAVARALGAPDRTSLRPLAPVLSLVGDLPLVIAADPRLGDPLWGALPDLIGRPLSLVPSARAWIDRAERPLPRWERVLLASGPDPSGALRETAELVSVHPGARSLIGERARVRDVVAGSAGSDLVHLSGHGRISERSLSLSSVTLADGPLLACDLASVRPAPTVVVITACRAGGFASALLAAGTRAVVASPAPVRDSGTGRAVADFHRALTAGVAVPEAVAEHLGRLGFVCLGA
ncbi:CHAT domain-containing protein [Nocardiopsis sp. N85]|uniref:CHAT domain-containing protein n=1 Tax=Nocardiopsis sp. N85 TaxID=3029400 RepID=UPI00237EFC05|nr:CHAT domain-containing protein [Nocardiopsis sp. N85]MDE3722635.1 CHAT domain-containing protein [Nocardiopsis sp. N85]